MAGSRSPVCKRPAEHECRHLLAQLLVGRDGRARIDLEDHAGAAPARRSGPRRTRQGCWPMSRQARIESTKAARAGSHMVAVSRSTSDAVSTAKTAAQGDEQEGEAGARDRVHGLRADGVVGRHQRGARVAAAGGAPSSARALRARRRRRRRAAAPMASADPVDVRGGRWIGHEPGDEEAESDGDAEASLGHQQVAGQVVVELARGQARRATGGAHRPGQRELGAQGAEEVADVGLHRARVGGARAVGVEAEDHELAAAAELHDGRQHDGDERAEHRQPTGAAQVAGDDGPVLRRQLEAARLGPLEELLLCHGAGIVAIPRYIATMTAARYSSRR